MLCLQLDLNVFFCNLGGSDDGSLSGSDGEEQKLWEETQIGKGVKRCPGDQVGDWQPPRSLCDLLLFFIILNIASVFLNAMNKPFM